MEKIHIIKKIIFLPETFAIANVSVYSLLKESGYFEIYEQVSETDIFEMLVQYPECIKQWLSFSEDKRSSSGWYFKQGDNGEYIVGIQGNVKTINYLDEVEACAAFIKREIEDIRKIS